MQKYLQPRETVGEAAADEVEEEQQEEEQQEDTEDSGGESGDDKCMQAECMVCGEKEEDDVDIEDWVACEMCSQWIHSKCTPIIHTLYHMQTFIAIFVYSSNFH